MAGLGGRQPDARPQPAMHTNTQAERRRSAAVEQAATQETSFASDDDERAQLITFATGGEQYAVDIHDVREITSLSQVTLGPAVGERVAFMLHGETVPILDLRSHGRTTLTPMHVVVVVENRWGPLGLLADQMPDVLSADLLSLCAEPRLLRLRGLEVPAGDLTIAGRLITLIDPSELRVSTNRRVSTDRHGGRAFSATL
jgi:chemotaxis signal transduction protein